MRALRTVAAVAAVAAAVLSLPPVPARAAECLPAGGADTPFKPPPDFDTSAHDLVLSGGGWGHGVGMSQYGAKGAALLGCDHATILKTYYAGTSRAELTMPATVRVGMTELADQKEKGAVATFLAEGGAVGWALTGCAQAAACAVPPPNQPAGTVWKIRSVRLTDPAPLSSSPSPSPSPSTSPSPSPSPSPSSASSGNVAADGAFVISDASTGVEVWRGGDGSALLDARHNGTVVRAAVGNLARRFRWGFTRFDSHPEGDGKMFVAQHVTSGDGATGMERYLWGLAEVPASWPVEALKAQAVAGRSYALKRVGLASREASCRCDLRATTRDQHYTGWDREKADRDQGGRWKAAVDATAGVVATYGGSTAAHVIDAFYSSSHGGWSEASQHVWGSAIPYLQAVDTSRWENAQGVGNSRQRWTVGFTAADLAKRFEMAHFGALKVMSRGPGGRPTRLDADGDHNPDGVRVSGTDAAGNAVVRWYSGEQLRSRLALYSGLVHVTAATTAPAPRPDITRACPPDGVPEDGFRDVADGSVHEAAIDCVVWWGVAAGVGDGRYDPAGNVRRDQMATFIANLVTAAGYPLDDQPPDAFADDDDSVHEPAINRLAAAGLVRGTGTDPLGRAVYSPAQAVTRGQMASFLVAAYEAAAGRDLPPGGDRFTDDDTSVHEPAINAAAEALIASGVGDGRYDPRGAVSRAQMASFLARTLNGLVVEGKAAPPAS